MKKRIGICVIGVAFFLYTVSLFLISSNQNPYLVEMSVQENYLSISREETGAFYYIPVEISNKSSRTVSSQLNTNLSYHLYRVGENDDTLISLENGRSVVPNIYPGDSEIVELQYEVPVEKGVYIIYIDLIEEGVKWYSESGMLTPYVMIEVR